MIIHFLHMAGSALDHSSLFNLSVLGGPAIKSIKALSVATLTRTAVKTLASWQQDYESLLANAEMLPGNTLSTRVLWNPCWDSPAIAALLRLAARGFPEDEIASLGLSKSSWLLKDIRIVQAAVTKPLRAIRKRPEFLSKVQWLFIESTMPVLHPLGLAKLFEKRLATTFCSLFPTAFTVDWAGVFLLLRRGSMHEAMCFIETLANSWTTSSRYHDSAVEFCAFGCRHAPDDLAHYICCVRLWSAIDRATGMAGEADPDSVRERLLLESANNDRKRRLTVAFSVCHAMKQGHLDMIKRAGASGDFANVLKQTRAAAETFAIKFPSIRPCRSEARIAPRRGESAQEDLLAPPRSQLANEDVAVTSSVKIVKRDLWRWRRTLPDYAQDYHFPFYA